MMLEGERRTSLLRATILQAAESGRLRPLALALVRPLAPDDHVGRLSALLAFCQQCRYAGEPVETYLPPAWTARLGGDCDDLVALLCALCWTLRYPWHVEAVGNPAGPYHYSARIGYPLSDAASPHGDARTRWFRAEPTVPAALGEPWQLAAERFG